MSVNITVNGKYIKNCPRHDLLIDTDRAKKEIENERRKMRIQQVRDVAKNMAKKVRTDVELEKENQLKKIEEVKAQEMKMWRQNVLSQKEKELRSSIFQVGTAHRAAREENKRIAKNKDGNKVKKLQKPSQNMVSRTKSVNKENILKNANVQTDVSGYCYPRLDADFQNMRKDNFAEKPKNSKFNEKSSEWENNSSDLSSFSSESSSLSLSESENILKNERANEKKTTIAKQVKKADPVLLEVGPHGNELNESNSHFNLLNINSKPLKYTQMDKVEEFKSNTEEVSIAPTTSTAAKLRFTQISDIIRQQKLSGAAEQPTLGQHQKTPSKAKSPISRLQRSLKEVSLKYPGNSRPVSTQTASKTSSSRSTNTRVQFYDYNNKFQKQYDQPTSAVEMHELGSRSEKEMNAMELAALENKSLVSKEIEINKIRQKSNERCQKAIEREQVRRACEELTAKLDALNTQRAFLPSDNNQFASHRIQQVTRENETKLNNAVEDILRRPVIITCPVIEHSRSEMKNNHAVHRKSNQINGLNLESAFKQNGSNSLNSSDSCGSILLGYVDDQSKQIANDIQKFKKQNGETNIAKAEKLQNLLNRINNLRENLIKELELCSVAEVSDKNRIQTMMNSITVFRKEHENILIDNSAKDSIEVRENNLKKKEVMLEKKLREFYEIHKTAKKMKHLNSAQVQTESQEQKESRKISKNTMEENIQNYRESNKNNEKSEKQGRDNITMCDQKDSSTSEEESEGELFGQKNLLVGPKPLKIIIKVNSDIKSRKTNRIPSKSPRKLSTLIQSPTVKKFRRKCTSVRSIDSNSTSYKSLPSKIQTNAGKILKSVSDTLRTKAYSNTESEIPSEEENVHLKKKNTILNPLMAHYVQRLLGMSRTSINALGVTSSDIETPSNSVINTTANLTAAETEKLASSRLESVQKFIEDNYSFIGEFEESIRQSNSTDSSLKTVEDAWKKTLKEEKSNKKEPDVRKPLKSSLKKESKKQKSQIQKEKQPLLFVDKSTQRTDNCTQRIAELTEMITKVRREKQKILETTLSSASDNGRNSTEYLDLPERRNNSDESTSKILDSQLGKSVDNLHPKSLETGPSLEKDKLTGMSRDSGISLSRPITVQEFPENPIDDLPQIQSSIESFSGQCKKLKPPISIARYSPQLPEDIPHELSTILEVDTPATSRLNTSVHASSFQKPAAKIEDYQNDQIVYRKFPTFEKYIKINNLDMTQFDPEFSIQFEKEFNEFINLAKEGKAADYEEFTSFSKYIAKSSPSDNKEAAEELLASLKLANLSFKRFPTRKEYLDKIGVSNSDLLDSQSLKNLESSKKLNSNSSSASSLFNIEHELKLLDILIKPFQQQQLQNDNEEKGSSSIASSSIISHRKQQADISGIKQFTSGATSTDDQSNNLEEDFKKIGIKWPSTMKKKTMETQALSSSTSSNVEQAELTLRRKSSNFGQVSENSAQKRVQTPQDTTIHTDDGGQQLNLREFLKKELLKRTATSSSLSFSDDSVASSILRSILGSITSSGEKQNPNELGVPTLDRHKTSTPMASQSISSARVCSKSEGGTSSVQLFSGESRLSSVHFINSSTDVNKSAVKNG